MREECTSFGACQLRAYKRNGAEHAAVGIVVRAAKSNQTDTREREREIKTHTGKSYQP